MQFLALRQIHNGILLQIVVKRSRSAVFRANNDENCNLALFLSSAHNWFWSFLSTRSTHTQNVVAANRSNKYSGCGAKGRARDSKDDWFPI